MTIVIKAYQKYHITCNYSEFNHQEAMTEEFLDELRERFPAFAEGDEKGDYRAFKFVPEIINKFVCTECGRRGISLEEGPTEFERLTDEKMEESKIANWEKQQREINKYDIDDGAQPHSDWSESRSIDENWNKAHPNASLFTNEEGTKRGQIYFSAIRLLFCARLSADNPQTGDRIEFSPRLLFSRYSRMSFLGLPGPRISTRRCSRADNSSAKRWLPVSWPRWTASVISFHSCSGVVSRMKCR